MRKINVLSLSTAVYFMLFGGFLYLIFPSFSINLAVAESPLIFQQELDSRKHNSVTDVPLFSLSPLFPIDPANLYEKQFAIASIPQAQANEPFQEAPQRPLFTPRPQYEPLSAETRLLPTPANLSGQPNDQEATALQFGYLIIPSINVNHRVTAVSVIDGNWDISQLDTQVGHLQTTGVHPGDNLAMTFIGHVSVPWPSSEPAPFADLILLKHGEQIIYRWNGFDYIYEVSRIFRVQPTDVELLYHSDPTTIQVATCSGWSFLNNSFSERLVTRATLIKVVQTAYK